MATAVSPDARALDAWYERVVLGSYRKVGHRNPKWDSDAEAFIRLSAADMLHGSSGPSVADFVARSRGLRAAGCDDPLVLYLAARAESKADPESRASSELFERAVAGMHEAAYPRLLAFRAASGLYADYGRRDEGTGKREALAFIQLRWFMESLDDEASYAPDASIVLLRHLIGEFSGFFRRNRAAILPAVEGHRWIQRWLRSYLAGERALEDAWDARGHDYAGKVTGEGWKGFEESLRAARAALTTSWQDRKDRPEAAAAMISVAMAGGQPGESPRLWFNRAVTARFDHEDAYRSLINALRVRWSGDPEALPAFARACAATRRFDTVVPFMAFEAVEQMEWDAVEAARPRDERTGERLPFPPHRRPPSLYRDPGVYAMIAAVLERYRREPAIQNDWRRYASLQAALAYKAGRYEESQRFLHDCNGTLTSAAEKSVNEPLLASRIEAYGAADGATTRQAEALLRDGKPAEAVPLFAAALALATPAARPYLAQRLATATVERKLAAGDSVQLVPAQNLDGWTPAIGDWVVEKGGSLLGTSGRRGLFIVADAAVGPDFEIEADVEVASTSNGQFQAGIVFGEAPSFWSRRWSSFRWKNTAHEGEVAYFSQGFTRPERSVRQRVPVRNRVLIRSWHGRLAAWLNGEALMTDYAPGWNLPQGSGNQIGFGAYLDDNTFSLRFHSARLRRLTSPSPPSETR